MRSIARTEMFFSKFIDDFEYNSRCPHEKRKAVDADKSAFTTNSLLYDGLLSLYLLGCDFQEFSWAPLVYVHTGEPLLVEEGRSGLNKHLCCLPVFMASSEGTLALLRLALEGIGDWWQLGWLWGWG